MIVYRTLNKTSQELPGVLTHLGLSPRASAERVEGMFTHQSMSIVSSNGQVLKLDMEGKPIGYIDVEQYLSDFCDFAEAIHIDEYVFNFEKPLRINDLWEDDPIGSAGPALIDRQQLSSSQIKDLLAVFSPFNSVVYPNEIFDVYSKKDIKRILKSYGSNQFFQVELSKRKRRAKSIGEDFKDSQYQEIVWLDLTFKFRRWVIDNGFDALVYSNSKEGAGDDCYVTLIPHRVERTGQHYVFLRDKYLAEMPEMIIKNGDRLKPNEIGLVVHALWCQQDPMPYWALKS